jgi:hypothetical protein
MQHATYIYACNMQPIYVERNGAAARRRSETCGAACGDDTAAAAKTTGNVRRRCALVQEALAALPPGHILVATDCDGPAAGAHPCEYSQGPSSTLSGSEPGTGPASAAALEPRGAEGRRRQARTNAVAPGFVRYSGFAGGEGLGPSDSALSAVRMLDAVDFDALVRFGPTPPTICSWTGLAPPSSALGLGSPRPHLHRDWAHPSHICTGIGLTPATPAPGQEGGRVGAGRDH